MTAAAASRALASDTAEHAPNGTRHLWPWIVYWRGSVRPPPGRDANTKSALRIVKRTDTVLAAGFGRQLLNLPFREPHALIRVRRRVRGPLADPAG